jgi:GxxExxY protein
VTCFSFLPNFFDPRHFDVITFDAILGFGTPGAGFLEKVYERALLREPRARWTSGKGQFSFSVMYQGACSWRILRGYSVEDVLLIELKCVDRIANQHTAQCL